VPDANLDLYSEGVLDIQNELYVTSGTAFKSRKSLPVDFDIHENGSTIPLDSVSTTLNGNTDTLIMALGSKSSPDLDKRIRLVLATVNRTPPSASKARVIALNAMVRTAGEQSYSVVFKNPGTNPAVSFNAVGFGFTAVQELNAGSIDIVANQQSTDTDVVSKTLALGADKVYVMALVGQEGGSPGPDIVLIELPVKS
jgi:hypothetical protein